MKKMYAFVLALACILSLAGCGRTMNSVIDNEPNFKGVVAEVASDNITVTVNEDDPVYAGHNSVVVSLDVKLKDGLTFYSVGDKVSVYYDGNISGNDPAKVNTVYAICIISPADREQNNVS